MGHARKTYLPPKNGEKKSPLGLNNIILATYKLVKRGGARHKITLKREGSQRARVGGAVDALFRACVRAVGAGRMHTLLSHPLP